MPEAGLVSLSRALSDQQPSYEANVKCRDEVQRRSEWFFLRLVPPIMLSGDCTG